MQRRPPRPIRQHRLHITTIRVKHWQRHSANHGPQHSANHGRQHSANHGNGIRRSLAVAFLLAIALHASLTQAADLDPPAAAAGAYSARVLAAINAYRVEHGLRELRRSDKLDALADRHSRNMAQANRLSHEGFRERQARAGSPICVENVGSNYGTPDAQIQGWIASPSHNANLLEARITQAGVGEASGYVTFIACA